jgi:hypothetical protein
MSKFIKIEKPSFSLILRLRLGAFLKKFKISSKIFPKSSEFKNYLLEQSFSGDSSKLSYKFFIDNLTSFLEKPENQKYESKTKKKFINRGKSFRLRHIATIPVERQFIATRTDGSALSPQSKKYVREKFGSDICCSPQNLSRAQLMHPDTVIRDEAIKISVLRSEPTKIDRIRGEHGNVYHIEKIITEKMIQLFESEVSAPFIEKFDFTVTQDKINKRLNKPRFITQNRVMDGQSAISALRNLGFLIDQSQDGRSYHWAHREAYRFGGAQVKENLDPMTAAANYQTLIRAENPIFELLSQGKVKEVFVSGMVVFDENIVINEHRKVPARVLYCMSTNLREDKKVYICVDPLSHQKPTVGESCIAARFVLHQLGNFEERLESVTKRSLFLT